MRLSLCDRQSFKQRMADEFYVLLDTKVDIFVSTPVASVNYCARLGRCFHFVCIHACAAVFLRCYRIFVEYRFIFIFIYLRSKARRVSGISPSCTTSRRPRGHGGHAGGGAVRQLGWVGAEKLPAPPRVTWRRALPPAPAAAADVPERHLRLPARWTAACPHSGGPR